MISRPAMTRAAVVLAAALIAACGCTRPGQPVPATPAVSAFDIGHNQIRPLTPPAGNEQYGRVLESVRMAETILDPAEVDAALSKGAAKRTGPVPSPLEAVGMLAAPVRKVLESHGMLAGYTVTGSDVEIENVDVGSARLLRVLLLRFPDAEQARLAARQMDATDAALNPDNVAVLFADYPGAYGHWRPTAPSMAATIANGSFVISVLAQHTTPDQAVLSGLVHKTFDIQIPRLRTFTATPPDRFAELPLDQDGMLARLLPYGAGVWQVPTVIADRSDDVAGWASSITPSGVVFGPHGTRLLKTLEFDAAVERVAMNDHNFLERFPDAVTARRVFGAEMRKSQADSGSDTAAPKGVPDAYCGRWTSIPAYWPVQIHCHVLFGRYSATVVGRNITEAHQRASAQYLLLVNSA
ncbi:DUF7373 family lipoprotein [Nocardia sp. CDC160]|uniref:DUF7373 family lipoprotein n=1 Tax=Nocardia sp. CDC160 TaxID=3112166 RepID=UPI002DBF34AF|nr:hypothetical protein [Nocardia sp. CDC160]MEC3917817.1 hypothetical protein [Nocardia sp. CDC160]